MLPNLQLFAVAMGTAGKNFGALRIFHELFSDMFEVRVYDDYVRYVVLIDPDLPEEDTDPPESTLIDSGTRKDFLAEYFDKYRGAIVKKIEEGGGKVPINKLGEHLKAQPEFDERVYNAALGKTNRLEQIVLALGFVLDGTNVRRKREPSGVALAPSDEEPD